jgi:hypothetical protein
LYLLVSFLNSSFLLARIALGRDAKIAAVSPRDEKKNSDDERRDSGE